MSIYFTWFPISGLGKPKLYQNLGDFTRNGEFTWRLSDCEEIEGVTHRRWWGWFWGGFYLEGSEYGFNCWRTDKQAVNVDGLFYITLSLSWIISSPHLWKLVSTNAGEISYPIHLLPLSKETFAVVPLPRKGSRIGQKAYLLRWEEKKTKRCLTIRGPDKFYPSEFGNERRPSQWKPIPSGIAEPILRERN